MLNSDVQSISTRASMPRKDYAAQGMPTYASHSDIDFLHPRWCSTLQLGTTAHQVEVTHQDNEVAPLGFGNEDRDLGT